MNSWKCARRLRATGFASKEIHQHRLAAADGAVDVEALELRLAALASAEQPAERRRFARQAIFHDPQLSSRASRSTTASCATSSLDSARGDAGGVLRCDRARHLRVNRCGGTMAKAASLARSKALPSSNCRERIVSHAYKECGHDAQYFCLPNCGDQQHDVLIRRARERRLSRLAGSEGRRAQVGLLTKSCQRQSRNS